MTDFLSMHSPGSKTTKPDSPIGGEAGGGAPPSVEFGAVLLAGAGAGGADGGWTTAVEGRGGTIRCGAAAVDGRPPTDHLLYMVLCEIDMILVGLYVPVIPVYAIYIEKKRKASRTATEISPPKESK